MYILNELLTGTYDLNMIDYNYPTCSSLINKLSNKYALKTGTTDTDAWTIGYNKDILIGVWNGYDNARDITIDATKISKIYGRILLRSILKTQNQVGIRCLIM